jgi:hypothetical protein
MKARVKATGEIGIVSQIDVLLKDDFVSFSSNKVEILQNYADATIDPDYWTRLEHQAAIATMGGICGNVSYSESSWEDMAEDAIRAAHALIQKLKEKEKNNE